jgi:hypothetical protein
MEDLATGNPCIIGRPRRFAAKARQQFAGNAFAKPLIQSGVTSVSLIEEHETPRGFDQPSSPRGTIDILWSSNVGDVHRTSLSISARAVFLSLHNLLMLWR